MLEPTHPTRLGLALNFAVYYHDVRKSPERACHLGKHAFDEAVACLDDSSSMQVMRDSMMILQLLRDDLVIWSSEMQRGKGCLLIRYSVTDLECVDVVSK
jgi:14-3-3 protein epsilon